MKFLFFAIFMTTLVLTYLNYQHISNIRNVQLNQLEIYLMRINVVTLCLLNVGSLALLIYFVFSSI
jgi:hypothetical protein